MLLNFLFKNLFAFPEDHFLLIFRQIVIEWNLGSLLIQFFFFQQCLSIYFSIDVGFFFKKTTFNLLLELEKSIFEIIESKHFFDGFSLQFFQRTYSTWHLLIQFFFALQELVFQLFLSHLNLPKRLSFDFFRLGIHNTFHLFNLLIEIILDLFNYYELANIVSIFLHEHFQGSFTSTYFSGDLPHYIKYLSLPQMYLKHRTVIIVILNSFKQLMPNIKH